MLKGRDENKRRLLLIKFSLKRVICLFLRRWVEIGERSEVGGSGQYLKGRELSEFIDGGVYSGGRIPDSGAVFKDGMNNGVGREHSGKGT